MNDDDLAEIYKELIKGPQPQGSPVLALLMGVSYSGKSTIAEKFTDVGFIHFWATVVKHTYDIRDEEMLQVARTTIKRLLQEDYKVVFDFTNLTSAIRQPFIDMATELGCEILICYINTNRRILLERCEQTVKAGESKGRRVIPKKAIDEMTEEIELQTDGQLLIEVKDGDTKELDAWFRTLK